MKERRTSRPITTRARWSVVGLLAVALLSGGGLVAPSSGAAMAPAGTRAPSVPAAGSSPQAIVEAGQPYQVTIVLRTPLQRPFRARWATVTVREAAEDGVVTGRTKKRVRLARSRTTVTIDHVGVASGSTLTVRVRALTRGRPVTLGRWTARPVVTAHRWTSWASGDGVADGSFGQWRGRPVEIAGTWNDNAASQPDQWSVRSGFTYGAWNLDLDNAVGGIYKDQGESWSAAAAGAYDTRWRKTLTTLRTAWQGRTGNLYLRFAHEFNGDWYPWSVKRSEVTAFKAAWARFRALQLEIIPQAKLVFCPNADTSSSLDLDWRTAFPGPGMVDVVGVDYYNRYPYVATSAAFASSLSADDRWGAPRGLERFRQFAASQGLPLALPEWSSDASFGDGETFVRQLYAWFSSHGGSGPGQLLYEIQFNVGGYGGNLHLYPTTKQPAAAAAYRALW